MRKVSWRRWAVLLSLCIALSACTGTKQPYESESETPSHADTPLATTAPTTSTSSNDAVPPESVQQQTPEDRSFSELSSDQAFALALEALNTLTSYRFRTSVVFRSEGESLPGAGSIELSGAVAGPDQMHLVFLDLEAGDQMEIIRIGERAWIYDEGAWEPVHAVLADALWQGMSVYAPGFAWSPLLGASAEQTTYMGVETVNNVPSHHYRSSHLALGSDWEGSVLEASGNLWIAEAGYPVRHTSTAAGIDDAGIRFSVTWAMELTDVGQEMSIQPPE